MQPNESFLRPRVISRLAAPDTFAGLDATVGDFWAWAFSDLRANTTRGVLAEFMVARAIGAQQPLRDTWDNFDVLAPSGVRVEVKASGYLQSWSQRRHSQLSFGRLTGLSYDADRNEYSAEREVRADVFVFAVQTCREPAAYDGLDMSQWEFWVAPADGIRKAGTRAVGMPWVRANSAGPFSIVELASAVDRAHSRASEPGADADAGK